MIKQRSEAQLLRQDSNKPQMCTVLIHTRTSTLENCSQQQLKERLPVAGEIGGQCCENTLFGSCWVQILPDRTSVHCPPPSFQELSVIFHLYPCIPGVPPTWDAFHLTPLPFKTWVRPEKLSENSHLCKITRLLGRRDYRLSYCNPTHTQVNCEFKDFNGMKGVC